MNESDQNHDKPPCRHLSKLKESFKVKDEKVFVLGIPDNYNPNNPDLISLLKIRLKERVGIKV